jgi:Flp pilus assembly protein TadB
MGPYFPFGWRESTKCRPPASSNVLSLLCHCCIVIVIVALVVVIVFVVVVVIVIFVALLPRISKTSSVWSRINPLLDGDFLAIPYSKFF